MALATRQASWVDNMDGSWSLTPAVAMDLDDESSAFSLPRGTIAASVQFIGTFDSTTCTLQCSNDDITYAAMPTAVAGTAASVKSVAVADLGYRYYRLLNASGTTVALLPIVVARVGL